MASSSRLSSLAASIAVLLVVLATASSVLAVRLVPTAVPTPTATCVKSTLANYQKSVPLTSDGLLLLHWNITAKKDGIIAAIEAKPTSPALNGWISIGWSKTFGKMAPGDAVVGNLNAAAPNSVLAYSMLGKAYTAKLIKKSTAVKLTAKSVSSTADGGKIVKFTHTGTAGTAGAKVDYKGAVNNMMWAYGPTQALKDGHADRGSISVKLNIAHHIAHNMVVYNMDGAIPQLHQQKSLERFGQG